MINDVHVNDDAIIFKTTFILGIHKLLVYGRKNMSSLLLSHLHHRFDRIRENKLK